MTNEEMLAKYASLNSLEDAYALMQENGYSGSLQDFEALCAKASDEIGPMELDDMDAVAGGMSLGDIADSINSINLDMDKAKEAVADFVNDAVRITGNAVSKGWQWVKENPGLTAEIGGSIVLAAVGITAGVKYVQYRNQPKPPVDEIELMY